MYGLVNRAIEQMVCREHGQAVWERIKSEAQVDTVGFVSNEPYPDEMTYQLVAGCSKVLAVPAEEILKAFGEFWVLHTALESYGPLMRAAGRDVREFLVNLPTLHVRVQAIYPSLKPPQFSCSDVKERSLRLHYVTGRAAGLESFVVGLLQGIGKMFNTPMRISLSESRVQGCDHSTFDVAWDEAA